MVDRQQVIDEISKVYKNLSSESINKLHKVIDILDVDDFVYDDVIKLYCYVNIAAMIETVENTMFGLKKFSEKDKRKFQQIIMDMKKNA